MSKLYFRYSTMNAGKSAQLLTAAHNYEELGMRIMLFNFEGDNRYGEGVIASRIGLQKPSIAFNADTNFLDVKLEENVKAIFVDEAQFLTREQVKQLHHISAFIGIPVLCYGLRTDFKGNLFEGSLSLMAHAETIEELKTVCSCGHKATRVARFENGKAVLSGAVVQIGDTEYKSLCFKCWYKAITNDNGIS